MLHFLGRYHLLDIKFHIQWRIFLFFSLAKAQRRKEIVIRSVRLPEAFASWRLCAPYSFFLFSQRPTAAGRTQSRKEIVVRFSKKTLELGIP